MYPALLVVLGVLVVGAVCLVVWTLVRIRKGPKPARGVGRVVAGAVCWAGAAVAVAYAGFCAAQLWPRRPAHAKATAASANGTPPLLVAWASPTGFARLLSV